MILPKGLFPKAEIEAMLPYVDRKGARLLETCLTVEKLHALVAPSEEEYDLFAAEAGGGTMDMEGLLQAVQAVAAPDQRRKLEQMRMMMQMRKVMTAGGGALTPELLGTLMGPEGKKQMDEMLPLLSMMQGGMMP